jgi:histidinol-phosphate aminotransferase
MKTITNSFNSIEQNLWSVIESHEAIRLHCNEMPFDIPQNLKQEIANKMANLAWNQYPDFQQKELISLLADSVNLKSENLLLGNGSSQLIQQIVGCVSKFISEIIIESPTFTLYHQICNNERMNIREWQLNEDSTFELSTFPITTEPALIIITSPNNPTGAVLANKDLRNLLTEHKNCIFLIDEAYGEFRDESATVLINEFSNLLVLKTFSKGLGLPSARFGYALGNKILIDLLRKNTIPFTINVFTELLVRETLTNPELKRVIKTNQERIKNLRDFTHFLLDEISENGSFKVLPSNSNFLLLRFQDAELLEQIKQILASRNIVVSYPLPNGLRLTIGNEVEMNKVVRIIKQQVFAFEAKINSFVEEVI